MDHLEAQSRAQRGSSSSAAAQRPGQAEEAAQQVRYLVGGPPPRLGEAPGPLQAVAAGLAEEVRVGKGALTARAGEEYEEAAPTSRETRFGQHWRCCCRSPPRRS